MAAAHMARFGEPCVYSLGGGAQESSGLCLVAPLDAQLWAGGLVQVAEGHTVGYFLSPGVIPEERGVLTFPDSRSYVIDQPPRLDKGVWLLVLRNRNA